MTKHVDVAVKALSFAMTSLAAAIRRFDFAVHIVAWTVRASAFAVRDVTFIAKGLGVNARPIARAAGHLTIAHRSLTATADCVAGNANDLTANDSDVFAAVNGSIERVDGFIARVRRVGPFVGDVIPRANGFDSFATARAHRVIARAVQISSRVSSAGHLTKPTQKRGSTVNAAEPLDARVGPIDMAASVRSGAFAAPRVDGLTDAASGTSPMPHAPPRASPNAEGFSAGSAS